MRSLTCISRALPQSKLTESEFLFNHLLLFSHLQIILHLPEWLLIKLRRKKINFSRFEFCVLMLLCLSYKIEILIKFLSFFMLIKKKCHCFIFMGSRKEKKEY